MKFIRKGSVALTALCVFLMLNSAIAFELGQSYWQEGRTTFRVNFPDSTRNADFSAAFREAIDIWNSSSTFIFDKEESAQDPCVANGVGNSIGFTDDVCGTAYGSTTLAVALTSSNGRGATRRTRIVFNNTVNWDVYNGSIFRPETDFRRVAIHELGHTLGLNHSDVPGAIMLPSISNTEVPQPDDIAGAAARYDTDADGVGLAIDNCSGITNADQSNIDGDALGDLCDDDIDGDGVFDEVTSDQSFAIDDVSNSFFSFGMTAPRDALAQTFTVGVNGTLDAVNLPVFCSSGNLTVSIRRLSGSNPSNASTDIIDTVTLTDNLDPDGLLFVDLNDVPVTSGQQLAIAVASSGSCGWSTANSGSYPDGSGRFANDGVSWFSIGQDLPFQTRVDPTAKDNCPLISNPSQTDSDNDGIGDVCDVLTADRDNDGVDDAIDNCPDDPNPDQIDSNQNGVGDICEVADDEVCAPIKSSTNQIILVCF